MTFNPIKIIHTKPCCLIVMGFCVVLSIVSCSNTNKPASIENPAFILPQIPIVMTLPEQRAEYLVLHYWDNFEFSDTTLINLPDITEQAFVDYINLLSHTSAETLCKSISTMLDKAINGDKAIFDYFVELYDKYLYAPNSPMR